MNVILEVTEKDFDFIIDTLREAASICYQASSTTDDAFEKDAEECALNCEDAVLRLYKSEVVKTILELLKEQINPDIENKKYNIVGILHTDVRKN